MLFRFSAVLSTVFLCLAQAPVLYGASSSDSSSSSQQTINYIECNHDVTEMYYFKHDNSSKDGSWLLYQTSKNKIHLYTQENQLQCNTNLASDNIEKCPQIIELAGYEPLTKRRGIYFNTVYLKKHKDINDNNFDPNTPKDRWPFIVKKLFAHNGTIKNAFFSNDEQYLIAQSDEMITITPIGKQSKYTLTPKNLDDTNFKHIALSPNNKLAICTQANKIYFINLEQCEFIKDIKIGPQRTKGLQKNTTLKKQSTLAQNNIRKKKKWWNKIIDNPWKSFAIAQSVLIATAITGFALYKWKPNWVKKCFSKFKLSFY